MREEILRTKGLLLEKEKKLKELGIRTDGLLISLRMQLNPYEDFLNLKVEIIKEQAIELQKTIDEAKRLKIEIEKIRQNLDL